MSDAIQARARQAAQLASQGRLEEALAAFQEIVRLAPDFALGFAHLANVLLLLGRYDEASTQAQYALNLDPTLARALVVQGAVYLRRSKFEEALNTSRRAL